jgi:hypothetical protein
MNNIYLLWEIPLALLSFLFYKVMKFIIGNLFTIYLGSNQEKAKQWRVLSQEIIDSPLSLPVLMTKGPRWNTHAIIGTLGPFSVTKSLAINLESANNSARSWIAVIYSFPGYETINSIESEKVNSDSQWYSIDLKPGKYTLGLRYYNWTEPVYLPAIKVDEEELVTSVNVPGNINDFYHNLINYKNWFYSCLHYYIFTILKLKQWLPESFVRNEYLPVGAPDTYFFYNYLDKDQALQVNTEQAILNNYDIYFTLYDRSSLPVSWCRIQQEEYILKPINNNGYYLFRVRPKVFNNQNKVLNFQIVSEDLSSQKLAIDN